MIDDIRKAFVCRGCEAVYSDSPVSSCDCLNGDGFDEHYIVDAEIIRNARRYLALRESGVYLDASYEYAFNGDDLDAAADRLMEGGV